MKPYLKQTVPMYTPVDEKAEVVPPDGYYLAFAELRGYSWCLLWAPYTT